MFRANDNLDRVIHAKDLMNLFGYSKGTAERRMKAARDYVKQYSKAKDVDVTLRLFLEFMGLHI